MAHSAPPPVATKAVPPLPHGENIPVPLWAKLFRPLALMDALRFQPASRALSQSVFSGQHRFLYTKKFQDWFFKENKGGGARQGVNDFLIGISPKIAPYCRQLVLKTGIFTSNHIDIFVNLTRLLSVYLKIDMNSQDWNDFAAASEELFRFLDEAPEAELRIISKTVSISNDFSGTLAKYASKLASLQMWKRERYLETEICRLVRLKKFRTYLNEEAMPFWVNFTQAHASRLEALYVKWEVSRITPQAVEAFGTALGKFTKLRLLALELNWVFFNFDTPAEKQAFDLHWRALLERLPSRIEKLSIDVQQGRAGSRYLNMELTSHLLYQRNLRMLRCVASRRDTFPLRLSAFSVTTLEIVCSYLKIHRLVANQAAAYSMLPKFNLTNISVFFLDRTVFQASLQYTVKNLILSKFALFDYPIAKHFATCFPNLEMFSFNGFHEKAYCDGDDDWYYDWHGEKFTFEGGLTKFVQFLPTLRVIRLADEFHKTRPHLGFLVEMFFERAKANPDKQFALYINANKNCRNKEELLGKTVTEVKNLRVF